MQGLDELILLLDSDALDENAVARCLGSIDASQVLRFEFESPLNRNETHQQELSSDDSGIDMEELLMRLFQCLEKFSDCAEVYSRGLQLLRDIFPHCHEVITIKDLLEKHLNHMVTEDFDRYVADDKVNLCFVEFFAQALTLPSSKLSTSSFKPHYSPDN